MTRLQGKILILSDVHLTGRFNVAKFNFLASLIKKANVVILNGDFLDTYVTTLASINNAWSDLFSLLKQKKTYYIFGNHDAKQRNADYQLFSLDQAESFEFQSGNQIYHIEHGHRLAPYLDTKATLPTPLLKVASYYDVTMTRLFGERFLRIYQPDNERMKQWQKIHLPKEIFLICGHSHFAELSLEQKYANSGLINAGIGQYLTIEEGKVQLFKEKYK